MFNYPLYLLIIATVCCLAWLVQFVLQLLVPRVVLKRLRNEKKGKKVNFIDEKPGVSVVVYTHNQGDALLRNLPVLLDNDYPFFEVIVVDDMSSDNTEDVLTLMEQRCENIFHTRLTDKVRTMSHRKLALLLGVKAAHNDIILMTKAQCVPATKDWISAVARNFSAKTDIVIAPVVFDGRNGLLARFCEYDLFQRLVTLFGFTLSFRGFSGWGNNMAFRKKIIFEDNNKAFSSHLNIHPGEDDLLVKEMACRDNVAVECSPSALVIDQDSPLFSAWSKDRVNRAFTAKHYPFGMKFLKGLDFITRYLFVFTALVVVVWAALLAAWIPLSVVVLLLLLRWGILMSFSFLISKELGIHRFLFSPIVYDLYTPLVDCWFWLRASFNNRGFYVGRV